MTGLKCSRIWKARMLDSIRGVLSCRILSSSSCKERSYLCWFFFDHKTSAKTSPFFSFHFKIKYKNLLIIYTKTFFLWKYYVLYLAWRNHIHLTNSMVAYGLPQLFATSSPKIRTGRMHNVIKLTKARE